jgi:hypothetical protein
MRAGVQVAPARAAGDRRSKAMRRQAVVVVVAMGLVLGSTAAWVSAHHAFAAEFDSKKPVKFTGTVTRMEWTNPHVWIHVDVKQPDGKVEQWALEGGAPSNLFRRGFTKASLQPGSVLMIEGYQAKDGSRRANARDVTFSDGRRLFVGSTGTGAPQE